MQPGITSTPLQPISPEQHPLVKACLVESLPPVTQLECEASTMVDLHVDREAHGLACCVARLYRVVADGGNVGGGADLLHRVTTHTCGHKALRTNAGYKLWVSFVRRKQAAVVCSAAYSAQVHKLLVADPAPCRAHDGLPAQLSSD